MNGVSLSLSVIDLSNAVAFEYGGVSVLRTRAYDPRHEDCRKCGVYFKRGQQRIGKKAAACCKPNCAFERAAIRKQAAAAAVPDRSPSPQPQPSPEPELADLPMLEGLGGGFVEPEEHMEDTEDAPATKPSGPPRFVLELTDDMEGVLVESNKKRTKRDEQPEGQETSSDEQEERKPRRTAPAQQAAAAAAAFSRAAKAFEKAAHRARGEARREAVAKWTASRPPEADDHSPSFAQYGQTIFNQNTALLDSLAKIVKVADPKKGWFTNWDSPRCTFRQHDLRHPRLAAKRKLHLKRQKWLRRWLEPIIEDMKERLRSVGDNPDDWELSALKLLMSLAGLGSQEIHCDVQYMEDSLDNRTLLVYATSSVSTLVPKAKLQEMADVHLWSVEKAKSSKALNDVRNEKVKPGQSMMLTGATPHKAPNNPNNKPRFVIFAQWTKKGCIPPDAEDQHYPQDWGHCN
jgi:hypothetical protein